MDLLVDDKSTCRRTTLTSRAKRSPEDPVQDEIKIRIIHDNHGILATHLKRATLVQ